MVFTFLVASKACVRKEMSLHCRRPAMSRSKDLIASKSPAPPLPACLQLQIGKARRRTSTASPKRSHNLRGERKQAAAGPHNKPGPGCSLLSRKYDKPHGLGRHAFGVRVMQAAPQLKQPKPSKNPNGSRSLATHREMFHDANLRHQQLTPLPLATQILV